MRRLDSFALLFVLVAHAPFLAGQNDDPADEQIGTYTQKPRRSLHSVPTISGQVTLESGGPPNRPATVLYCDRAVTVTDKRGRYSFTLEGGSPAGGGGGLGGGSGAGFGRCAVSAELAGFRADAVQLSQARPAAIVLHPLAGFDPLAASATTFDAPKKARRLFQKGLEESARPGGKAVKAAASFEQAVALHPTFAEAWTALGETRLKLPDLDGAVAAFEHSIEADPAYPRPYRTLVGLYMQKQNLERAVVLAATRLELNAADDRTRYYHALAAFGLKRYDEAERSAAELVRRGSAPRFPQVHQILGTIQTDRSDYKAVAANLRAYLDLAPDASSVPDIRRQLAEWERNGLLEARWVPRHVGRCTVDRGECRHQRALRTQRFIWQRRPAPTMRVGLAEPLLPVRTGMLVLPLNQR